MPFSMLYEEGYQISLVRELIRPAPPADQKAIIAALFVDLAPILQPITLDLELGCTYVDTVLDDPDAAPAVRFWHLHQDPPPPSFAIRAPVRDGAPVARAPVLDPTTISAWLQEPLDQEVSDRVVTIEMLGVDHARVRLCSPDLAARPVFDIHEGSGKYEIPVENRTDGSWVSGPRLNMLYPPIRLVFTNVRGDLSCHFYVTWTRWATPGTAEYQVFCGCVKRLLASSWRVSYRDEVFQAGLDH